MLYYTVLPAQPFPCIHRPALGTGLNVLLVQIFSTVAHSPPPCSPAVSARRAGWSPGGPRGWRVATPARLERPLRCDSESCCGSGDAPTDPAAAPPAGQSPPFPRGAAAPPIVPRPQDNSRGGRRSTGEPHPRPEAGGAHRPPHPPPPPHQPPAGRLFAAGEARSGEGSPGGE